MKRQMELFLIILLPILGTGFSLEEKIMTLDQKPRTEDNDSSPKKVKIKTRRRHKKDRLDYLKEHEQKVIDLVKAQKIQKAESVQIDWD